MAQSSENKAATSDVQEQIQEPASFEDIVQPRQAEADRAQSSNAMLEGARVGRRI